MTQRVLLLSSVHPATDPRILYKIAPSLAPFYEVFCALPNAGHYETQPAVTMVRLPEFKSLLFRIIFTHPVLLWKCIRLRPDLVHIFVPELIPIAFFFQWLGAQIIYEVQENLYKKFQIKQYNNLAVFQALFRYFDHAARRNFYCIFTEHAYLNEYQNLALPSAVVHNYVSLPFIDACSRQSITSSQVPTFFYSGVISMERCFDTLVAALVILKRKHQRFHVHLFGPVRFSQDEANLLPGYERISQHLTFYGYTDLRLAVPFAQESLAGIALLKPLADYPDSYTTKLFEYMALKLPVITSDFALYKDVVEKSGCGFCISPYDSGTLAETLEWIIDNPAEALEMGNNGKEAVKNHYNWKTEQKILLLFYKSILRP
ncbi:glycosyltransferase [Dyadobacter sp. NIV53]|uniref:glycosyltransferase n=1 Tax=Dyadobacter sp. NIV53 TaxID=2861765 RepID=UPI001C886DCA|nr:glycosyltransferase [Dyadobacter sp. NIV53]